MKNAITGNLFTDAEMSLFGVVKPKSRRGRGPIPGTVDTYTMPRKPRRNSIYSVTTTQGTYSLVREFNIPIFGVVPSAGTTGKVSVTVCGSLKTNEGFGFGSVSFRDHKGNWSSLTADAFALRNLAQLFNAAANSCHAKWRKSSITS